MYPLIVIQMLGGLALFLYGMRLMSNSLRESSSGKLKSMMEKVTGNPFKAFLLGLMSSPPVWWPAGLLRCISPSASLSERMSERP